MDPRNGPGSDSPGSTAARSSPLPTDTEVLVAGGGTVGLSTALFLAHHGVSVLLVERQDGPSIHPRATGMSPRTAEMFRELGLEGAVNDAAIDMVGTLGRITIETLAGANLAALAAARPLQALSPIQGLDTVSPARLRGSCPQDRLDAVLLPAARARGATVNYSTELISFEQSEEGVSAVVEGPEGRRTIRAHYLVAADGVRSAIRSALGIATSGAGALGVPNMSILFRADLRELTQGYTFTLCELTQPRSPGLLVTVDGQSHWVFHSKFDPDAGQSAEDFTPERCKELIRTALGAPELPVEILSKLPWRVRAQLAERFRQGRVFLVGDAAHTVPPLGAFGMNTGVADAHNLAWKLAYVLRGRAGAGLLETYNAERHPVAALAMQQAMLRLSNPRLHWERSPEIIAERARVGAVNAPIVTLGYRYDSAAVIDARPELPSTEDIALDLDGSPGSRVPHVWVEREGERLSTLDLIRSRFTLLAGPRGEGWLQAASQVAHRLGIELGASCIGSSGSITTQEGEWPTAAGIHPEGAVLVRPDGFVAWRSPSLPGHPERELEQALTRVLGRALPMSGHRAGSA